MSAFGAFSSSVTTNMPLAELFDGSRSGRSLEAVAVIVMAVSSTAFGLTWAVIVMLRVWPTSVRPDQVAVTVPFEPAAGVVTVASASGVAETKRTSSGSGTVMVTFGAGAGPLLVAVTMIVTVEPGVGSAGVMVFVSETSATGI